jgi:hypothetical protein
VASRIARQDSAPPMLPVFCASGSGTNPRARRCCQNMSAETAADDAGETKMGENYQA